MNENFHRPTREAERKHQQSCARVAPTFLKGGRKCPPFLPFMLAISAIFPASADDFENCIFSPLLPAKLLCTFPPACQPPQGHQVGLQTRQVQSRVHRLCLPPDLLPSCSSSNVCQVSISNQPVLHFQSSFDFSWMSFHWSPFSPFPL